MTQDKFLEGEKFEMITTAVHPTNGNVILVGLTNQGRIYFKVGVAGLWIEVLPPEQEG